MSFKYEWKKAIEQMRLEGYAVVAFAPQDLEGVHPNVAETIMALALGQKIIEDRYGKPDEHKVL